MDFNNFSEKPLICLYEAIRNALEEDDKLSEKKYYVREFKDWKECADELERVMREKKINFSPILWSKI